MAHVFVTIYNQTIKFIYGRSYTINNFASCKYMYISSKKSLLIISSYEGGKYGKFWSSDNHIFYWKRCVVEWML